MSLEYLETKGINPPKDDPLEMDEKHKIKLGSRNPGRYKQQDRKDREHQEAINEKPILQTNYGNGEKVEEHHKASGDPFPHQCRYYEKCDQQINDVTANTAHFNRCHPLIAKEENFYSNIYKSAAKGRTVYQLALLYGRSVKVIEKILYKNGVINIPKWGRRSKEIKDFHHNIRVNRASIVFEHHQMVQNSKVEQSTEQTINYETGEILSTPVSIPKNIASIRGQDYLTQNPTEENDMTSQMEWALVAAKGLVEENKALKAWRISAEEREETHLEAIKRLQDYNQSLGEWSSLFQTAIHEVLGKYPTFAPEMPDEPPTL